MPIHDQEGHAGNRAAGRVNYPQPGESVQELTERIRRGTYEVDPARVADAMLSHPGVRLLLLGGTRSDDVLEPGD